MRDRMSSKNGTDPKNNNSLKEHQSALPKTPQRRDCLSDNDDNDAFETSSTETIRDRRGFRPLSVFTRSSVFLPFDFDAVKAMEEIEDKQKNSKVGGSADTTTDEGQDAATPLTEQSTPSSTSKSLTDLPFSNDSELSLRTFLAQTSPNSRETNSIRRSFSALCQLPAPDLSQHPAFASDPFTTQSDLPDLVTTSTLQEIKDFAKKTRNTSSRPAKQSSESNTVLGSANRGNFTFSEQRYDPQTPGRKTSYTNADGSPLAKHQSKPRSADAPSTSPSKSGETDRKRLSSGRLRKISTIFKPRNSTEKPDSPSSTDSNEITVTNLKALEAYLRTVTNSPTYVYAANSWFPRHPSTGRAWKSRNLKCTNCLEVCCACCGRTCCAYKAAVMALETHKNNPEGRAYAIEKIQQITMVFPYGKDAPTFLQCTRGPGGNSGCGKMVCPDCCGICPDEICADIQCRKCKRDPWGFCTWHSNASKLIK